MKFTVTKENIIKKKSSCLVIGIYKNQQLSKTASELDSLTKGYIKKIIKNPDINGDIGQSLMLFDVPNVNAKRILLVGLGEKSKTTSQQFTKIISSVSNTLKSLNLEEVIFGLLEVEIKEKDSYWMSREITKTIYDSLYKFEDFKSKATKSKNKTGFNKIIIPINNKKDVKNIEKGIKDGTAIAKGIEISKNLGNTPANICNPTYLAKQAKKLGSEFKSIKVKVLNQAQMEKLKMGSLLSVAKGSKQPPQFITMEYKGTTKKLKPIVFVGKGITFDTGGNSLKPAASMIGMKYDMCGAATVFGVIKAAASLKLPLHIIGVVPSAENMPGHKASRPDDIVTSMSGRTIEILNTDAEGRLILCDALTYCERYEPQAVIDIATLTGACVVALGHHNSGLFSNNDKLTSELKEASTYSNDKCWHMPIDDEYKDQLKSTFADVANIGGPDGGSITAACFLSYFTEKYPWAHLDIAGTATYAKGASMGNGSSGRPVTLLMQYLINKCA